VEAGAYVLGALPPAQRLDYHQHLETCAECRGEVADLAALPGLLGRLDATAAAELDNEPAAPRSLLPATLGRLRQRRRRQRWRLALAAAVVVLLALAGVGGVVLANGGGSSPRPAAPLAVTLNPMLPVAGQDAVRGEIALVRGVSGTGIELHCLYLTEYPKGKPWELWLQVYPKGGGEPGAPMAVWTAEPGTDMAVSAMSQVPMDQIDHVVLRRGDGTMLLTYQVT
jgi:hypothetical protein